jgi:hypothetical protein
MKNPSSKKDINNSMEAVKSREATNCKQHSNGWDSKGRKKAAISTAIARSTAASECNKYITDKLAAAGMFFYQQKGCQQQQT